VQVDIWSDIVCPWCYIGKRRFERALAAFPHKAEVEVRHRAFQLNPAADPVTTGSRMEMLKGKYRLTDDQIATMDERMEQLAAEEGLAYNLRDTVVGNTQDAHRLVQLARTQGREDAMLERLYGAYFTEGRSIFGETALVALAAEAGLDAGEARAMLRSEDFREAVAADARTASDLGATGVPFFVLASRYGVSGAQASEVFADALANAWAASTASPVTGSPG